MDGGGNELKGLELIKKVAKSNSIYAEDARKFLLEISTNQCPEGDKRPECQSI